MTDRSYGQFCAVARSLDRIGDRWTLLVVRELLRGPRTFGALQQALPGISTTLLTDRLNGMRDDGLVVRNDAPQRSKAVAYALTPVGLELEPVLMALVRWGGRWMVEGPGDDHFDPAWAGIALKALLHDTPVRGPGSRGATVHITIEGDVTTVQLRRGRRQVSHGATGRPDAVIDGSVMDVLGVAAGLASIDDVDLDVRGDAGAAHLVLVP